jgi:hypothetical protein
MIFRQAIDHLIKRYNTCGCEDTGLPHTAPDDFASPPRFGNKIPVTAYHRAYRSRQPFAQAKGHRIGFGCQFVDGHIQSDGSVKKSSTIHMYFQAVAAGNIANCLHIFRVEGVAAAKVMGVFKDD